MLVRSGRPLQIDECASEQALSMKRRATYYTDAFAYMYVYVRMYVRASTRASQSARFRILVNVWMNCIVDLLAGEHAYIYVYVYTTGTLCYRRHRHYHDAAASPLLPARQRTPSSTACGQPCQSVHGTQPKDQSDVRLVEEWTAALSDPMCPIWYPV